MNECKIITVTNQKGGVGKTTTSAALMSGLHKRGKKVLAIDMDPQLNLSYLVKANPVDYSIKDAINDTCDLDEAIQTTSDGDFIQSNSTLEKAFNELDAFEQVNKLKDLIDTVKDRYDYIIIDTPPSISPLTISSLVASTNVIIPVQAETFSFQGTALLSKTIKGIQRLNKDLSISGILIVRFKARAALAKQMEINFEQISKTLNTNVFHTKIREAIAVQESQYLRKNLFDYSKSNVADDYNTFIEELLRGE